MINGICPKKKKKALKKKKLLPYLKLSKDFGQNDKNSSHGLPNTYLELDGKQSVNWNGWRDVEYIFALANGGNCRLEWCY